MHRQRMREAANGIVYRSVRDAGGECLVSVPALVREVRVGG